MSKRARKIRSFAGALLLGVSGFALLHNYAESRADEFNNTQVIVNDKKMSLENFYCNLDYNNGGWQYIGDDGKAISVDSLCDGGYRERLKIDNQKCSALKVKVDTIFLSYSNDKKGKREVIYTIDGKSTSRIPKLGYNLRNEVGIRHFVSDNSDLAEKFEFCNEEYFCTFSHELRHFHNRDICGWNSYEIKYMECCLDEISAELAQALEKVKRYNTHDGDEKYLGGRYSFLDEGIKDGTIRSSGRFDKGEEKYIADKMFNWWLEKMYAIYDSINNERTIHFLESAPYKEVRPNWKKHEKLVSEWFKIDGYDFWPYIKKREKEIFDKISAERRTEYKRLTNEKFNNLTYFEKLEELKNIKREHYQQKIMKDYATAQLIRFMRLNKKSGGKN